MAIARGTDAANAVLSHTISHSESLKLKQTRGLHRDFDGGIESFEMCCSLPAEFAGSL